MVKVLFEGLLLQSAAALEGLATVIWTSAKICLFCFVMITLKKKKKVTAVKATKYYEGLLTQPDQANPASYLNQQENQLILVTVGTFCNLKNLFNKTKLEHNET